MEWSNIANALSFLAHTAIPLLILLGARWGYQGYRLPSLLWLAVHQGLSILQLWIPLLLTRVLMPLQSRMFQSGDGILFSRWANSAGLIGNLTMLAAWTLVVLLLAADGLLLLRAAGYPVTGRWPLRILALRMRHWHLGIAVVVLMVVALLIGPITFLLLWLWN